MLGSTSTNIFIIVAIFVKRYQESLAQAMATLKDSSVAGPQDNDLGIF